MMLLFKTPGVASHSGSQELLGSYKFKVPSFIPRGIALPPMPRRDNANNSILHRSGAPTAANPTRHQFSQAETSLLQRSNRQLTESESSHWITECVSVFDKIHGTDAEHLYFVIKLKRYPVKLSN